MGVLALVVLPVYCRQHAAELAGMRGKRSLRSRVPVYLDGRICLWIENLRRLVVVVFSLQGHKLLLVPCLLDQGKVSLLARVVYDLLH